MYFTYKLNQRRQQNYAQQLGFNFRDVYNNTLPETVASPTIYPEIEETSKFFHTYTKEKDAPFRNWVEFRTGFDSYFGTLSPTANQLAVMFAEEARIAKITLPSPIEERYHSFLIPKASGGQRQIDAPLGLTRAVQTNFKDILARTHLQAHDAAHAYVIGRSPKTALQVHQKFESKFFLKVDIEDFFGSHTRTYILQQFAQIYPIAGFLKDTAIKEALNTILDCCMFNGKLPQGSPASPIITNICMIPIDYAITKLCGKHFRYTRYADDIMVSSKFKFDYTEWADKIQTILRNERTPFQLKTQKTRFGSSAGRNWNLGLMLNKENNITLGHKKKEHLKALLHNFIKAYSENTPWSVQETQVLQGQISYFHSIEPEYTNNLITKANAKYSVNLKQIIKNILR